MNDDRNQPDRAPTMLWVCGKNRGTTERGDQAWDLMGIFAREEDAIAACVERNDFIGPVPVDIVLPQEPVEWPGCRYPLAQTD